MKIILFYDVGKERVHKYYKLIRQYLPWKQRSVFYGELMKSQLFELKSRIMKLIKENDQVIIFTFPDNVEFNKEVLGRKDKNEIEEFII